MAAIDCLDIFDAVYSNVKKIYLHNYDSIKVKSKTVTQNSAEDEQKSKATVSDPATVTEINSVESEGSVTETVKESVERVDKTEAIAEIRKEIEEKFLFALAAACSDLAKLDKLYRKINAEESQPVFSHYYIGKGEKFPLCERFVFSCIMFISSMAIIDIDEKRSDVFYAKYADSVASISNELSFSTEKIVEKYPY